METRISKKFKELKEAGRKALITYITAGDPDLDTSYKLVVEMERAGVNIIELGIPYSDPLADGPIIQRASQRALEAGTNIGGVFSLVEKIRQESQIALVLLVYFNNIFVYGFESFLNNCREKGVDGLIIPDLPLEEREELLAMTRHYNIDLIPLVAPTSKDRIRSIVKGASGFVYCVSSVGVTGKRNNFQEDLAGFLDEVKKHTRLPLGLGFGISTPEAVIELRDLADGLIVGSALVEEIEKGLADGSSPGKVFDFAKSLSQPLLNYCSK